MAKKENGLSAGVSEPGAVDAFMLALKHPLHDAAQELRTIILGADKQIGEGIYWNAPCFYFIGPLEPFDPKTYKRYIVGFNFFKQDAVRLIFLRGADVMDRSGLLEGSYPDGRRLAIFHDRADVQARQSDLKKIIKELVKNIKK